MTDLTGTPRHILRQIRIAMLCGLLVSAFTASAQTGPQEKHDTISLQFAPQKMMFLMGYKENAAAIGRIRQTIRENIHLIEAGKMKIRVLGYCTSYGGSYIANVTAARKRSNLVKSYFILKEGLKEEHFHTTNYVLSRKGMTDVTALYFYSTPQAAEQEDNLSTGPDAGPADTLAGIYIPESGGASEQPDAITSYRFAVKTNVAYLAATVANLGVEFGLGEHFSIDVPAVYSPYTVARNYRMNILATQPELRYWLEEALSGHFFGLHAHAGIFNIAVGSRNRYQSPEGFYGAGLSYGYMLPLASHWTAEFTIGAGYVYTRYDTYYNIPNGACFEKGRTCHYWGITRLGIGLVYRFGKSWRDLK